jgi:hypothetical protein
MVELWAKYGKTHVAAIGSVATWATATFEPHTWPYRAAAAVLAVGTILGVFAAPHKTGKRKPRKRAKRAT